MKVKFPYSCSCGATGIVQEEESLLKEHTMLGCDCALCSNTVVIIVNELDKEKKVVNYTVQIRKTEREKK